MVEILMCGCSGKMGRMIADIVEKDSEAKITAGIDKYVAKDLLFPVYSDIASFTEAFKKGEVKADVIVDFSNPSLTDELINCSVECNLPLVFCTTGATSQQIEHLKDASSKVAVMRSANMSLGVNLIERLVKEAAEILCVNGFDPEIVEKHHKLKVDAPSGTALELAKSVNEGLSEPYEYVFDRSSRREQRLVKEIGISAVRGGSIVGEHEVIFAGLDEVIEIKHTAYSKAVFAKGAIAAAKFLKDKKPGFYSMKDVLF
ncbi:MAG: 4-hydroxy-tetrahydrodipicolinate reductase [Lachnospiraceae bacterium]|nr:4-hydroxy-tetrahydrodipicolinate reductase [Lachnospiraceae bacterium]